MVYDYIIVGSGPAGTVTAYCLQLSGAKCLIMEEKLCKGEKICGGLLTWSGVQLLSQIGLDLNELIKDGAAVIHNFTLVNRGERKVRHYHGKEYAIGTTRKRLDYWLLEKALQKGAEIEYGIKVQKTEMNRGLFHINGRYSKKIVFATGARGYCPVETKVLLKNQSFGLTIQICGETSLTTDSVYFWYINNSNDYFWAIPNGNDIWNLGVWFQKLPKYPVALFEKYMKQYGDEYFKNYKYIKKLTGAFCGNVDLSLNLPKNCFGIGDFAGKNVFNTGEGLRYAIESAIELAEKERGVLWRK